MKINIKLLTLIIIGLSNPVLTEEMEIEEVVTVSSKIEVPIQDVVGSVNLVTQESIEERVVNSLDQVFENTIGVTVPRGVYSGRALNEGITIRGIGDKRVNVLIDGVRIADAYQSGGFGKDLVDPILLKRVEVLKGPSSALYGSDGLAGTVSYTTKDASDLVSSNGTYLSVALGDATSTSMFKTSVLGAFVKNNFEGLIQVTDRETNELQIHNSATETLNPMEGKINSVLTKLKMNINEQISATLVIDSQEFDNNYDLLTDLGTSYFPAAEQVTASIGNDISTRERVTLSFDFESKTNFFDSGSLRIFSQTTDQSQITDKNKLLISFGMFGPSFTPAIEHKDYQFNQDLNGYVLELNKNLLVGSTLHNIVYGFETEEASYSRPKDRYEVNLVTGELTRTFFGPEVFPNKAFPDSEVVRSAFFLNDRFDITPSTTFVLGLRFDNYEQEAFTDALSQAGNPQGHPVLPRDDDELSVKVGAIQDLSDNVSLFLQYAQGYRNPDFTDAYNTYTNYAFGYTIIPNPNLQAEYSSGTEFGLRGQNDRTKWSMVFFRNNYKDFITTEFLPPVNGVLQVQYNNLDSVETKGLELEVRTDLSENVSSFIGIGLNRSENITNKAISPDEMKFGITFNSSNDKVKVNYVGSYVTDGPRLGLLPPDRNGNRAESLYVPDRFVHDLFLNYNLNENTKLNFGIRNILNKKYWDWISVAGLAEGTADEYLNPGTNLSFELRYTF